MKPLYWTRIVSPVPNIIPSTTQNQQQDRNDLIRQAASDGELESHNNNEDHEESQKHIEACKKMN